MTRLFVFVCSILAISCSCARPAAAQPCPIYERYLVPTAVPGTYAALFGSYVQGVADVDLTFFIGDDVYDATVPRVVFTRRAAPNPGFADVWYSEAAYLRFAPGTPVPDHLLLGVEDPATHAANGCTSEIKDADAFAPAKPADDAFSREAAADVARATAGASIDAPAVAVSFVRHDPKPSCRTPNVDAATREVYQGEYPPAARGRTGRTEVRVELDERGEVSSTTLYRSSGTPELDAAGLYAAAHTTYSPEIFRCRPVKSIYQFAAVFTPLPDRPVP